MKKMKKTISLILAVIMMLSVVPVQGFALFENLQNPRIADAEFIDKRPVSAQDVYDAAGDSNNNDFQYIGYGWKYEYMVYLSDGTEIKVVDDYGSINEKDKFEVIAISANSSIELLLEQIKEFKPKYVAVYNEESAQKLKNMILLIIER